MTSIKVTLNTKLTKGGRASIYIRIIHDGKKRDRKVAKVRPDEWDGKLMKVNKSHPHARLINLKISQLLERFTRRVYELEIEKGTFHVDDIFTERPDIVHEEVRKHIKSKKFAHSNAGRFILVAQHIENFAPDAKVKDVNKAWMDKFVNYLMNLPRIKSINTVNGYVKKLKTVLRSLPDYHDKEVLNYSVPQTSKDNKQKLTREELSRIAMCNKHRLYCDAFMMQYDLCGTRIRDVLMLTPRNIREGRISFHEQKTARIGKKGKFRSFKITDRIYEIIERWKGQSEHYLLPIVKLPPSNPKEDVRYDIEVKRKTALVNKMLKLVAAHVGIKKNISTHVARHSFATHAAKSGLTIFQIQQLLGHSDTKTTQAYIDSLLYDDEIDDLAGRVLG